MPRLDHELADAHELGLAEDRLPRQHPEKAHHVGDAVQVGAHVGGVEAPGAAALSEDRRDAALGRFARDRAAGEGERRAFPEEREDAGRVEAGHRPAQLIELRLPGEAVGGVGPQGLREVAPVAVDVMRGEREDLAEERVGDELADRPIGPAGSHAVEIEAVDRRDERGAGREHRHVEHGDGDDRPGKRGRVELPGHDADGRLPGILGAVGAPGEAECRAGPAAVDDDHGHRDRPGTGLADLEQVPTLRPRLDDEVPDP